jgi:hypothetical protein
MSALPSKADIRVTDRHVCWAISRHMRRKMTHSFDQLVGARCVPGQVVPCPALPSRNHRGSHSHERHTVHGLQEHNSHDQDVPSGDGNNGRRLRSPGQTLHFADKPTRDRQTL